MLLSFVRTLLLYLILIAVVRLMGKRQLGQMEPVEFVVAMLVADLASIPMQDGGIPLLSGLVPILTVLGLGQILCWLSLRCIRVRRWLCGKPVILIENGRILQRNLQRTCITLDELTGQLRLKDVLDLKTVQYAILETSGRLSVFPRAEYAPLTPGDMGCSPRQEGVPLILVMDGKIRPEHLQASGKDEAWLMEQLRKAGIMDSEKLLLASLDTDGKLLLQEKEKNAQCKAPP